MKWLRIEFCGNVVGVVMNLAASLLEMSETDVYLVQLLMDDRSMEFYICTVNRLGVGSLRNVSVTY
jgi:hypothetical protein